MTYLEEPYLDDDNENPGLAEAAQKASSEMPFLFFINPMSGGGLGAKLIEKIEDMENIYIAKLPESESTWSTLYPDIINDPNLRVCAAGGDGTVNWVISLLKNYYTGDYQPPLSIIPFGTGNDMSRSLGWGKGMKESSIERIEKKLTRMKTSQKIENVDVWSLQITIEGQEPKDYQMINYFSIGVDAAIALKYEQLRQEKRPKSQFASLCLYVPAGSATFGQESNLVDYTRITMNGIDDADVTEEVEVTPNPKERTVVFQSTITMYGGKIDWQGKNPASMTDGKLEVKFNKGVTQLTMCQMGIIHGRSFGQAKGARVQTSGPCCFQVDGEAFRLESPCLFTITHTGNYPFINPNK